MIKESFCCPHCFDNQYIQQYIEDNYEETGDCPYCKRLGTHLPVNVELLGGLVLIGIGVKIFIEGIGW